MTAAMMGFERSDDYQPLFWVRGRPIHVTLLLVILHCIGLTACCLAKGFFDVNLWRVMSFSSDAVLHHGAVWQIFTYVFAHYPSIWFLLDAAFLFIWGREVERFFGRKMFAALYAGLVLIAPVFLLTRGLLQGTDQTLAPGGALIDGSVWVHLGVFVIFATLYPNVQFFFGVSCVWIAAALIGISTLQCISGGLVNSAIVLWLNVALAFVGTRYAKMGSDAFNVFGNLRDRFPRKTVPSGIKPRINPRRAVDTTGAGPKRERYGGTDVHESIDPLLDKISKSGLASLTHSERAMLEKARVSLLRKDRGD